MSKRELAETLRWTTNVNWLKMPEGLGFWDTLQDYLEGLCPFNNVPHPGSKPTKIPDGFNLSEEEVIKVAETMPHGSDVREHLFAYAVILQRTPSFDETSEVQTHDEREAHIFMVTDEGYLIGAVKTGDIWHSAEWDRKGVHYANRDLSLVHKVKAHIIYVNVDADGHVDGFGSRELADNLANSDRVARIRVDAEEGRWDP